MRLEKNSNLAKGQKVEKQEEEIRVPQVEPVEALVPPPGLTKIEKEKWLKEQEKKQILKQIAIDRAIKNGTPVVLNDDSQKEETIEEKFKALYEKMEKCYPIRTPKAAELAKCLETIGIYISKGFIFFLTFIDNILGNP